jgi:hypothetical protein
MKAFPQKYPIDASEPHHWIDNPLDTGMDLRDYFAAKAMVEILAEEMRTYKAFEFTDNGEEIPSTDLKWVAHRAYYMADAMMEVRK